MTRYFLLMCIKKEQTGTLYNVKLKQENRMSGYFNLLHEKKTNTWGLYILALVVLNSTIIQKIKICINKVHFL